MPFATFLGMESVRVPHHVGGRNPHALTLELSFA